MDDDSVAAASYQQSMIPCEFCLELFDEHVIAEHQVGIVGTLTSQSLLAFVGYSLSTAVAACCCLELVYEVKIELEGGLSIPRCQY